MGGEWFFYLPKEAKKGFRLKAYQKALTELYDEESKAKIVEHLQPFINIRWGGEDPADNVFVVFTYICNRHCHGRSPKKHNWTILWDPTNEDENPTDLHARCQLLREGEECFERNPEAAMVALIAKLERQSLGKVRACRAGERPGCCLRDVQAQL